MLPGAMHPTNKPLAKRNLSRNGASFNDRNNNFIVNIADILTRRRPLGKMFRRGCAEINFQISRNCQAGSSFNLRICRGTCGLAIEGNGAPFRFLRQKRHNPSRKTFAQGFWLQHLRQAR
jgi:hypothetical protein